ncbi:unnamed protein product [Mytilus edulis]|uniref:Uncharacterized protein n=1 Tax=Mytilus edulis TaxID=6550 RepID=A0A8S3R9Z9_MYTED|nr:unnamed protein product [Mytilus edulis]
MTTNFYSAQEDFNRLISSLPPFDLSKFVIWLDLKISEYKIFGRFVSVAQQTDENKTENVQKSSEFRNNVCALKNKTRYVIGEDENSTTQKIQKQDTICAKIFHEVAQQTDENKAEKLRRSLEIQDDVYITEDGHRSLPFQIIESYGNVNEAEIHGAIYKASNSSNTNVNTDIESFRGEEKDDNQCQKVKLLASAPEIRDLLLRKCKRTESVINQEESFDGEMKGDVVNVLIEVENTGSIDQKSIVDIANTSAMSELTNEHSSKRKECQNISQQAKFQRVDRGIDENHDEYCQINNRAMDENQDAAAQINYKDDLLKVGNIVAVRPYTKRDYKPGRPWIASLKEISTRNVKVVWLSGTYDTKWIEDPIYFPHSIPRKQVECSFVYDYMEPLRKL